MELTKEQIEMLSGIWIVLKDKLVAFLSKTRSKDVNINNMLDTICIDTLKLFNYRDEHDANIAIQFIDFVIDTLDTTKSLGKTISKVDTVFFTRNEEK